MSNIPVIIEMSILEEIVSFEGFSSIPILDTQRNYVNVGGGFMQHINTHQGWSDIELEFSDSMSLKQTNDLFDWFHNMFSQCSVKKIIRIKALNHNFAFTLIGAFPKSFEQKFDIDCVRNSRKLTRKVLFEKKGNESINVYLNTTLSVDRIVFENN